MFEFGAVQMCIYLVDIERCSRMRSRLENRSWTRDTAEDGLRKSERYIQTARPRTAKEPSVQQTPVLESKPVALGRQNAEIRPRLS